MDLRPLVLDLALAWERFANLDSSEDSSMYDHERVNLDSLIERLASAVLLGQEPEPADG